MGSDCSRGPVGKFAETALGQDFVAEQEEVSVSVSVLARSGQELLANSASVPVTKNQPNGPDCEPTCYDVDLKLDPSRDQTLSLR